MRPVVSALFVAAAVTALAGCAAVPGVASAQSDEITSFGDAIEDMPGVDSVTFDELDQSGMLDLTVVLTDEVSADEVADVGIAASHFRLQALPPGVYTGDIEIRHGDSSYSYFAAGNNETTLRDQLRYWVGLFDSGIESAVVRAYTPPMQSSPAPESASGGPVIVSLPIGRYVGLRLADGPGAAEPLAQMEAVRGVEDPGASSGQWRIEGLAPQVIAEFLQGPIPAPDAVELASAVADAVPRLGERGSLRITEDRSDGALSTSVEITTFDDALEGASPAEAEARFRELEVWTRLPGLLTALAGSGGDFDVSVVSNTLEDAGNFHLAVGVYDCTFAGDAEWSGLSDDLNAAWIRATGASDEAGATQACAAIAN